VAFNIRSTIAVIKDALVDSGLFFSVEIARPGHPVGEGPSATIHGESMRVVGTTLTNPIEVHVLKVRIWRAMNTLGDQERELEAMTLTSQVLDLLYGDFTLGAGIRAVDVAGIHGDTLAASFTDDNIETAQYHIADITVPLIVDSATAFAA
jgi:hypothetical protein